MSKKIRIPGTNLEAEVVPEEVCVRAEFFVATSEPPRPSHHRKDDLVE